LAEAIIAEEWNDRIDLVGNSLEVEEHQHLAHVWRDIVADDLDRLRHGARPRRRNNYRPYSSWRRHHAYGGVCGYPSGESSHSSWRPSGVRSRNGQTGPSASTPRPAVKSVRYTVSPSRTKMRRPTVSPWSALSPKSALKPLPAAANRGLRQPIRFRYSSMSGGG